MMSDRRQKVMFIVNSLEGGGAERVFATLINGLSHDRPFSIELLLLDAFKERYVIPGLVRRHQLDCRQKLLPSIRGVMGLTQREKPDLLFSFLTRANAAAIIAGKVTRTPVVISERVNTSSHFGNGPSGRANKLIVRMLYPQANCIVAPSHGVAEDLIAHFGVSRKQSTVIYNPVMRDDIIAAARREPGIPIADRFFVAVGRLVPNKNFNMLIQAFATSGVAGELIILGEGPERSALEALAKDLGIAGRVRMPGFVPEPYPIIARALAYLSASNAEGFPNALVEALALGVPVVATDCDSGPGEILSGEHRQKVTGCVSEAFGILTPVGDMASMAEGIKRVCAEDMRYQLAAAATKRGTEFDAAHSVSSFGDLIERVLVESHRL